MNTVLLEKPSIEEQRMPTPQRNNDDGMMLLVNSINEQVRRISEAQEALRTYLLSQIDELRKTIIQREEYRDNLDVMKRDIIKLDLKIDKLEENLITKIEKVGSESKEQQSTNYKTVIRVQATILVMIASAILTVILKVFFHVGG